MIQRHGRLDCAINSAAIDIENVQLADCDDALFDRIVGLNLRGAFLCMKYGGAAMMPGGIIRDFASDPAMALAD